MTTRIIHGIKLKRGSFQSRSVYYIYAIIDIIPGLETDHVSALLITGHPCC